jgi:hypothetical protein
MSLFSGQRVVIWPKAKTLDIYLTRRDDNILSFDINLWQPLADTEINRLSQFLKSNHFTSATVLIEDNVVFTKSFIYDQAVTTLDPKEVVALAKDMVSFDIDPTSVTFELLPKDDKTLVQTRIFNQKKLAPLLKNLSLLNLKLKYSAISESLAKVFSRFYDKPFFVFYPLDSDSEYIAALCNKGKVYFTSPIKKALPEVKKIINYSKSYFSTQVSKVFLPETIAANLDLPDVDKTTYSESQLVIDINLPSNLPLPVAGIIGVLMENKKNILPIIAVFLFTAIIAAVIVWAVLTQTNKSSDITNPSANLITPAPTLDLSPTPEASLIMPAKTTKFQVLNATDISGQAATIKAELIKLGFASVTVGNSKETATGNEIQLKPALSTSSAYFKSKVAGFTNATVTELKANATYDAIFIIGTDLKTGQPVATATPKLTPTVAQ